MEKNDLYTRLLRNVLWEVDSKLSCCIDSIKGLPVKPAVVIAMRKDHGEGVLEDFEYLLLFSLVDRFGAKRALEMAIDELKHINSSSPAKSICTRTMNMRYELMRRYGWGQYQIARRAGFTDEDLICM